MMRAAGWHLPHVSALRDPAQLVGLAEGLWLVQWDAPATRRYVWVPGRGLHRQGRVVSAKAQLAVLEAIAPARLDAVPWLVELVVDEQRRARVLDCTAPGGFRERVHALSDACPGIQWHYRHLDDAADLGDAARRAPRLLLKRWSSRYVASRVAPVMLWGAFRVSSASLRRRLRHVGQ